MLISHSLIVSLVRSVPDLTQLARRVVSTGLDTLFVCKTLWGSGEQLTLKHCNLRVDHAMHVQLTAASESKVLRRIRMYCGIRGVLKRSHEDK